MYLSDEQALEIAKLQREAIARVAVRMASQQCGEAFKGLDTNWRSSYISYTGQVRAGLTE